MTNNKQQTAVEWLIQELQKRDMDVLISNLYIQAKEMEKEQMIDFSSWLLVGSISNESAKKKAEHYYKHYYEQTYGGNK
jgi:Trm5-related predicted tRNA methylase